MVRFTCSLLDQVVQAFYTGSGEQVSYQSIRVGRRMSLRGVGSAIADAVYWQQQNAQRVLTQFQDNADAWQRVPAVLETSPSVNTKVGVRSIV